MAPEEIKDLPKVMLHDHLDGGLRPSTIIELAKSINYKNLPSYDPSELQAWILGRSKRAKLELYLESFEHTIAVMQTAKAIERVSYECGEDLAKDGIVYAESRFAPELFQDGDLSLEEITTAAVAGFNRASADFGIQIHILCSAMKQFDRAQEIAEFAVSWESDRKSGSQGTCRIVGFDLAGPEEGFPCSKHLKAIEIARSGGLGITLHAGEGAGPESIADALEPCEAERLGHGVRIIEDLDGVGGANGALASKVKDLRIPLEVCPTSNVHTGISADFASHPLKRLYENDFLITLNTDNRLMSEITLSQEFENCQSAYGWGKADFHRLTVNAMESAFCSPNDKQVLLKNSISPRYL